MKKSEIPAFKRPTIGSRHYLSETRSGHIEIFLIKEADSELMKYIGQNTIEDLINSFWTKVTIKEREPGEDHDTWGDVLAFLSKTLPELSRHFPVAVGVAFWAKAIEFRDSVTTS